MMFVGCVVWAAAMNLGQFFYDAVVWDTGVRSRPGCTWRFGPYSCRLCVGTFAAACPYI